jgi:hypothetical protein
MVVSAKSQLRPGGPFVTSAVAGSLHRTAGTLYFGSFVLPLLANDDEQHDATVPGEVVVDPPRHSHEVEPKLEQPSAQSTRVRYAEQVFSAIHALDVGGDDCEVDNRESVEPLLPSDSSSDAGWEVRGRVWL